MTGALTSGLMSPEIRKVVDPWPRFVALLERYPIKCEVERDPDETGGMKSRVHPTYKTKYRVRNWASYERALIGRGNITIWLSRAAIAAWKPEGTRTRGAPPKYSDLAIETALTLRLLFHLPLRQAEGFLTSLFHLMGLDLRSPDHTTLSRRGQHLNLTLRRVPRRAALHLFIDSTGLSMVGEGEWAAAKHGRRGRRGWKKLHLGVDQAGVIVAQALTDSAVDDASTGIDLIETIASSARTVTADAAYDTLAFYETAKVTRKRRERSRTMWASEDALPEPRTEGRAIDPAVVERMFDATRGAHVSPGELEHLWRGQPGPPAGAWYCTGIDWAQKRDSTVAAVVRCETTPLQLVAVYRTQRRPWRAESVHAEKARYCEGYDHSCHEVTSSFSRMSP